MKHKIGIVMLAIALVVSLPATACAPTSKEEHFLSGSTAVVSSYYAFYAAVCQVAMDNIPGVYITLTESGGAADNLKRLFSSDIDCGGMTLCLNYDAINGRGVYEGNPQDNTTRTLFMLVMDWHAFWVRADSGITSVYDLEGRKFSTGMPGTGSQIQCAKVLDALGIQVDDFAGSLADAVTAIKDGRLEGILKATAGPALDATIIDLRSAVEMTYFGLSDEEVDKVRQQAPGIPWMKVPAGAYKEYPDSPATNFFTDYLVMGVTKDFPEDIAYEWTKAVHENHAYITKAFPGHGSIDIVRDTVEAAANVPGSYLHPGAIRFYREMGVTIPESVIPPEMK
jgi:hypothetical protein